MFTIYHQLGIDANKELLTLHELIGHRLFQILTGMHKARTYVL